MRPRQARRKHTSIARACLASLLLPASPFWSYLKAQTIPATPAVDPSQQIDPTLTTLHVYTTRLQTVALVIGMDGALVPVRPEQFRLRVDHGEAFRPSSIHLAAQDPLTIAVLLDLSDPDADLMSVLPQALGSLRQGPLTAADHVEVYAVDCAIFRANLATDTAAGLTHAAEELLADPRLHKPKHPRRTCEDSIHLWDATAMALRQLQTQSGRRVLLVVSDGADHGSLLTPDKLLLLANRAATAIFALPISRTGAPRGSYGVPLDLMGSSGGLLLQPPGSDAVGSMATFVNLLRHRYVLEFPRPGAASAEGSHQLEVELRGSVTHVRATGTSTPFVSRDRLLDPSTVSDDGAPGGATASPGDLPPATVPPQLPAATPH